MLPSQDQTPMTPGCLRANFRRVQISTPVGTMIAVASERGLCALDFEIPTRVMMIEERLRRWAPEARVSLGGSPALTLAREWLHAYFSRRFSALPQVPIDLMGTPFERSVWEALRAVPLGWTLSYGELATWVGKPKGARAVGGASRRNPVCLIVPCHRIVGRDGSLTGYGGGLEQKEWLLKHEETS